MSENYEQYYPPTSDPNQWDEPPYVEKEVGPPGQRHLYSQAEFLRDYTRAVLHHSPDGYPAFSKRLRLNDVSEMTGPNGGLYIPYDPNAAWCLNDYHLKRPSKTGKTVRFIDDGGTHPPTQEELAHWQGRGVRLDQRGMPVHPYAEAMLLGGETPEGEFVQPGAVVSNGNYCTRGEGIGPIDTGDFLALAEHEGKLHGLFIERRDNGLLAIPGGHLEPEDTAKSQELGGRLSKYEVGAIRELEEETGLKIEITPDGLSCSGLAVVLHKIWAGRGADPRATVHAWPEGEAHMVILPEIPDQEIRGSDDATNALWLPLNEETFNRLRGFSNHYSVVRQRGVRIYRDKTGSRITPDGDIW